MQGYCDVFPAADAHVADDKCVHPGFLLGEHLAVDFFQFVIPQEDVHGDENLRPESVCIFAQPGDILYFVPGVFPCPELRPGDIYGIGTAVNRSDADVSIPCRRKKFQAGLHPYLMAAIIACAFFRLLGLILVGSAIAFW